jgi:hypothetical protein
MLRGFLVPEVPWHRKQTGAGHTACRRGCLTPSNAPAGGGSGFQAYSMPREVIVTSPPGNALANIGEKLTPEHQLGLILQEHQLGLILQEHQLDLILQEHQLSLVIFVFSPIVGPAK